MSKNVKLTLTREKKACISELCMFTGASEQNALSLLMMCGWDVARAADEFFTRGREMHNGPPPAPKSLVPAVDKEAINIWFDQYADLDDEDSILDDGIHKFCEDMNVNPQDILLLIVAWKMKSATMCCFTREEWEFGMTSMGCENIQQLNEKIPKLRESIRSDAAFKDFYAFCFNFAKEPGQKSMSRDVAIALWELILVPRFSKAKEWVDFIQKKQTFGFSKDTWILLLDFFGQVEDSFDHYDENSAWPVLIDEFMEWRRKEKLSL